MDNEKQIESPCDGDLATMAMGEFNANDDDSITHDQLKSIVAENEVKNLSDFKDVKTIGWGGIGAVMAGFDPALKREVAIKVLRPANRYKKNHIERFIREVRATAQIDHPNVVPVHTFGVFDDAGIFFTMKKVDGKDLRSIISELAAGNPQYLEDYPLNRLMEILIATCQAVAYAHYRGVIHRDLKPANIMVGYFGEVQVMDWGMVKYLDESQNQDHNDDIKHDTIGSDHSNESEDSQSGEEVVVSGTPAFMSPEQAAGRLSEVDARTDIYSLGCIMYGMLTLEDSPFVRSNDTGETLNRVIHGIMLPPRRRAPKRKISKELNAICVKAMAVNPELRYQSVNEMIKDIRKWQADEPVSAYSDPILTRVLKLFRRRPLIPSVLAVALLTIFTYWAFIEIDSIVKTNSYLRVAEYNINQGELTMLRARATFINMRRYQRGENINRSPAHLEQDFAGQIMEYNNYYNTAGDFLQRANELNIKNREVHSRIDKMLIKRLRFYLDVEDFDKANRLYRSMKLNQRKSIYLMLKDDKELDAQIRMLLANLGYFSVLINRQDAVLSYTKLPQFGNARDAEFEPFPAVPLVKHQMREGAYLLKVVVPDLPPLFVPFKINICGDEVLNLKIPDQIPEGMRFIPGGKVVANHVFHVVNHNLQIWDTVPDFFISRHPVSFGEYRKFWLALDDQKLRQKYMPKLLKNREYHDIFDHSGNLLVNVDIDSPVFGVDLASAKAYCRWLSRRLGQSRVLPSPLQWRRASAGMANYEWQSEILFPSDPDNSEEYAESVFGMITRPDMQEITSANSVADIANSEVLGASKTSMLDEESFNRITFRTAMTTE